MKTIQNKRIILYFLPFWAGMVFLFGQTALFSQTIPDYGTIAPQVEASKTLTFSWEDVDKYPVITAMAFIPGANQLITGGDDCQLCLWNLENGALLKHFQAHDDWVQGAGISPDGSVFASVGQNGEVRFWNPAQFTESIHQPVGRSADRIVGAHGLSFSPDGKKVAVCGFENYLAIFDPSNGRLAGKWKTPSKSNTAVRFSPDGALLAAAGRDGTVRLWDAGTMNTRFNLSFSSRRIHDVAFSADGRLLAAGGEDSVIVVWDTTNGQEIMRFNTGIGKTYSLCFCGDKLASGDSLNSIRIWSLTTGKETARCFGHTGTVAVMEYHPETNELVSAGYDTTVRFWPLSEIAQ